VFGFAMIWHMWLLAGASFVVLIAAIIFHTFNYKRDYYIPAEEVADTEAQFEARINAQLTEGSAANV
jgi:cytochrome o ubiquinol oxidase subunit 1